VAIDAEAGRVTTASGEVIEGDLVVVAAGAWLPDLLPAEFGELPTYRQALCYVEAPARYRAGWETAPAIVVIGQSGIYTLPPAAGTGLKFGNGPHRRAQRPSAGFDADIAEAADIIAAFGPYLRDAADYKPLRMQVGYYTMKPDRRFALSRRGRRMVVTNCDGQMFKFGPLVGNELMASFDGERPFDDLTHWAAGH
jgi:sarcosine oxidase